MDSPATSWTLGQLAETLGGELLGPADLEIKRPVPADWDAPDGITFAENAKYLKTALEGKAGAILIGPEMDAGDRPAIRVAQPRAAFGQVLAMARRQPPLLRGIHPTADIHPKAWVDRTADIGAFVTIEKGARVGPNCRVYAGCYIGEDCVLGEGVTLYPNVTLMQDVHVGDRSICHAGCVLGADGFGYVWDGKRRVKIVQVGGVRLGSDVELGAGVCIDRATCGDTLIADGVKIDNLVQIGHNCRIGEHTVIAGHTSVAGSVRIGDRVTCGGQAAMKDHVVIEDDVVLGGRTGVMQDISQRGEYWGTPAVPIREALRQMAALQQLPDLIKRIKLLERELAELKAEQA